MAEITKKTKAFAKDLIIAGIIKPCLRNKAVMETLQQVTELLNQEAADKVSPTVGMLYHEYTDWVETYHE